MCRAPALISAEPGGARSTLILLPLLPAAVSLLLYALTMRSEIGLGDSAELSLQAYQLGVTHPPGYPVHTFLGKLFGLVIADPAMATNWLSGASTALAVYMIGALVLRLTGNVVAGVCAPLIFASAPMVWSGAVRTEVYNVNVCLVVGTFALTLHAAARADGKRLAGAAVAFGLSLGTGMSNLLLVPGFLALLSQQRQCRARRLLTFMAIALVVGAVVVSWSLIRARTVVPLGIMEAPDGFAKFMRFLSARQYRAVVWQEPSFYLGRVVEHGVYWGRSLCWMGIFLGLAGLQYQWASRRRTCIAMLLLFAGNMGYFTFHTWIDYQEMVTPSYFFFSVWCGYGLASLTRHMRGNRHRILIVAGGALTLVAAMVTTSWKTFREEAASTPITDVALASFDLFPPDATVLADWYKFATLVFFQETRQRRPDVRLVERTHTPRYYEWGAVDDVRDLLVSTAARGTPVVIDVPIATLPPGLTQTHIGEGWFLIATSNGQPKP